MTVPAGDGRALGAVARYCLRVQALEKRGVPAGRELDWGRPSDALVDAAQRLDASLVVIGTHGRSAFEKLLFGSTAERVARRATVPGLTVREKR